MIPWDVIERTISEAVGAVFVARRRGAVAGGCINAAYVVTDDHARYFVKLNRADRVPMFAAEAAGLQEIGRSRIVRVPEPVCWGAEGGTAFLVLEYVALRSPSAGAFERLGAALAELHRRRAPLFGWSTDNTIGASAQANSVSADWVEFYREQRLLAQLLLARRNGYEQLQRKGERVANMLPDLLAGHRPRPSLVHGDLWIGNVAMDERGEPVLFDPAVYYGDRETDVAMTELFGGFPPRFYAAYDEAWPRERGYLQRRPLYQLYHLLNHANLFGGAYVAQAEDVIEQLLDAG